MSVIHNDPRIRAMGCLEFCVHIGFRSILRYPAFILGSKLIESNIYILA